MDNEPVSRLDEILGPVGQSNTSDQPTSRLSEIIGDAPEMISAAPQREESFLGAEGYTGEGAISGGAAGAVYGLANKILFPVASAAELIKAQKNLQAAEGSLKYFRDLQGAPADVISKLQQDVQKYSNQVGEMSRKIPGASGAENYARVMSGQKLPDVVSAGVEDMTKANTRGTSAYQVAERDAQALAKIKSIGEGSQRLVGSGKTQLMLPELEAARVEQEGAARAKLALEQSQKNMPNRLKSFGSMIARSPFTAGMLSGAGTGLSLYDAINSYQRGDKANALLSGIEAGFGGLSMVPNPLAKGVGAAGGLSIAGARALADYLGEKYSLGTSPEAERAFSPSRRQ